MDDWRVLSGIRPCPSLRRRLGRLRGCLQPQENSLHRFPALGGAGGWSDIFSALAGAEAAPDRLFIDSTCIKVHRCAGGGTPTAGLAHGIGLANGKRNTTLHAVCAVWDEKGARVVQHLPPGSVHDCMVAQLCLDAMPPVSRTRRGQGLRQRNVIERMFCRL